MISVFKRLAATAGAFAAGLVIATGAASALSTKECSTKYQAAKDAGTLGGKGWQQFRKEQCGADDAPAVSTEKSAAVKAPAEKPAASKASGNAVFPSAIAAKFSSQTPTKQRFNTCLEQYRANKASGANGGLKWVQKGGGYYSQCNAQLKK
ncbi:MAG: hypothetical protein Q7T86_03865 [Hyphomicrobiaceae bacterium]|nr:hypothetical protein [Hyphomicrobiaceae bacterium]